MGKKVVIVFRGLRFNKKGFDELAMLAEAAGYSVVGRLVQKRRENPKYNIGPGKVDELRRLVNRTGAEKVIFYNELKPVHRYNLAKEVGVPVEDRIELILEIFAQRAGSREAKLQIELARLKHNLSLLREQLHLAKMGELPGFLGGGERALDTLYRHTRRRIAAIEKELRKARLAKASRWARRLSTNVSVIALTGYTGAGKTTLFERLTGSRGYVDGKPFATLATTIRRTVFEGRPILVSDTIGFIEDLPPTLMDAFYTTFSEIVYADLILLVVDASEKISEIERKLRTCKGTLEGLGVNEEKVLLVGNKVDKLASEEAFSRKTVLEKYYRDVVMISALKGLGIDRLVGKIFGKMKNYVSARIALPSSNLGVLKKIEDKAHLDFVGIEDGMLVYRIDVVERLLPVVHKMVRNVGGRLSLTSRSGTENRA